MRIDATDVPGGRLRGQQLHIAEGTVKVHLHNIYEKLGVDSRLELMGLAQSRGWI